MNKLQLVFLLFLCKLVSTQISSDTKCACSEYSIDTCVSKFYCSWDGYGCVDLDCTLESQKNCYPEVTMFQCQWNYANNQCIYYPYTCNQITEENLCDFKSYHGLDCMWSKTTGCQNFSCITAETCNFTRCSYWQGACGDPTSSLNCESLSNEFCQASDGQGQFCDLNDNNKCSSYDAIVNCPQLSDNKSICQLMSVFCIWEDNTCRKIMCEDNSTESVCDYVLDPQSDEITPCFWTGSRCRTASDLDIENYSISQCTKNTQYNYKWENSECQACQQYSFDIKLGLIFLIQLLI